MKLIAASAIAIFALAAPAVAQQTPADVPVVVTTGEGVVKRVPDRAYVSIAAESRAKTPAETQKLNADAMSAVLAKVKALGLPADAIRTSGYELRPEFDYANNKQTLRGYVARNSVEVRVDDLPKLGEILDVAVSAGATSISDVRFDLKDRSSAERDALQQAVGDARRQADTAAAAAGMKVERVVRIDVRRDSPMPPRPMMAMRAGLAQASEPPIAPGELEVRASVTVTTAIR
jgi:uncharacterized protein YggE